MQAVQCQRRHEFLELCNEFDFDLPLFDQAEWLGDDQKALRRGLGLTPSLLEELRQWLADWRSGQGWSWDLAGDEEDRRISERHQARGEELWQRVEDQVRPLPVRLEPPPDQVKDPRAPLVARLPHGVRALFSMRRAG